MKSSAQKVNATTQKFIEIEDIVDDMVLLSGGKACVVMEVIATNFALQSIEEQQVKILTYASLLNSLSFPIQIVILSRRLDISSYIKLLDKEANKTQNQMLGNHIRMYKDFIARLVQTNTVLDKKIYLAISFSVLEKGASGVADFKNKQGFIIDAKNLLTSKATSIGQELLRIGLKSKILGKNELLQLFYGIYNAEGERIETPEESGIPIVKGNINR